MPDVELARRMLEIIPICINRIRTKMRASSPADLSIPQFRVMASVYRGRNKIGEIANHLGVSQPAVSNMVSILISKKFIERKPHSGDRRMAPLRFTKEGRSMFLKLRRKVRLEFAQKIDELNAGDKVKLRDGLEQLERVFMIGELGSKAKVDKAMKITVKTVAMLAIGLSGYAAMAEPATTSDSSGVKVSVIEATANQLAGDQRVRALVQPDNGKTFQDAWTAALRRSESVGIQDELLVQAHETGNQVTGALFPTISGSATFMRQTSPATTTGTSLFPSAYDTTKISADQPLFRGLRDFAALRQSKALFRYQQAALQDAARTLYYSLSTAYHNVLAYSSDVANYGEEIKQNQSRLKELLQWQKIGRARETDVLTEKATIAGLESSLETSRGQLQAARESLAFVTGWDRDTPIKSVDPLPTHVDAVADYLKNIEKRSDVTAAREAVNEYEEAVPIARGGHFPNVDLLGDYYFFRPGVQDDVHWDVSLAITLPIFQGGIVQSQVRGAESQYRQYNLSLSQVRRTAEQEIRTFHDAVNADLALVKKFGEAADIGRRNYLANSRDFRNGLVTNLDVLTALTSWQDSLRALDHQEFQSRADYEELEAASAQRKEIFIQSEKVKE